eukprot:gb/GECH01004220.1/.p1 GENE.gb/GECH01004220.1/~~gb/GECH01004220.1/.p1  ORF type:complete len:193 (+),score=22.65 gb/GECH01004220.1/:1-579(+)
MLRCAAKYAHPHVEHQPCKHTWLSRNLSSRRKITKREALSNYFDLPPSASKEQIRHRYIQRVKELHPDLQYANKTIDEHSRRIKHQEFAELNSVYQSLIKDRLPDVESKRKDEYANYYNEFFSRSGMQSNTGYHAHPDFDFDHSNSEFDVHHSSTNQSPSLWQYLKKSPRFWLIVAKAIAGFLMWLLYINRE